MSLALQPIVLLGHCSFTYVLEDLNQPVCSLAMFSAAVSHSLTLRNNHQSNRLLQVLRQLPTNLAVSVLQGSVVPFNVQLPALPEDLHGLAVQAAFPDIVARGCLSLDVALVGSAAATAALSAFRSLLQAAQKTAKLIQTSMRYNSSCLLYTSPSPRD